jgi:predicted nucleic acid-binding protein
MPKFADIVDEVTSLSLEEMEQVETILKKVIIEKRRQQILENTQEALKMKKEGKLKFYDNPKDFLNALNEE